MTVLGPPGLMSCAERPLGVPGAEVEVRAAERAYVIRITSPQTGVAGEIEARARRLLQKPSAPSIVAPPAEG